MYKQTINVDSVNREALWKILVKFGCPPKCVSILRLLHDNMQAKVLSGGTTTDAFRVGTGVKQGCVIAPTLFSIYLTAVLFLVEIESPQGISISYRCDGSVFNLARLKAKKKTTDTTVREFQYADDAAAVSHTETGLQTIVSSFNAAYEKLGLQLNIGKTKVLSQNASLDRRAAPSIKIREDTLESVDHFCYLGSQIADSANIDFEVQHRLQSASAAFGRLRKRCFDDRDLSSQTKIMVYRAAVVSALLYGAETWTTYRRHLKALERYHQRCLRKLFRIPWEHRRTNISVLEQAQLTSIEAMIVKSQLRWSGHLVRMEDSRLPKQLFYSELHQGKRTRGGQSKRYKDTLKSILKQCSISHDTWEHQARNRPTWRREILSGIETFERRRREKEAAKRQKRKDRAAEIAQGEPFPTPYVCHVCGKQCMSRIGLYSHTRTHAEEEENPTRMPSDR